LKEVNCQVALGPNSAPLNQQAVLVLSQSPFENGING